jgi:cellulose synthase/poly-beta-1,6-N-acetylglucosamine synthase-like glycosyltransferase
MIVGATTILEIAFWMCAACVLYPYVVYPLLLGLAARLWPRPVRRTGPLPRSFSIVVAAHNEAARIETRLRELAGLVRRVGMTGEIIVVSDGSTDGTAERARRVQSVQVLELAEHRGKAAALTCGVRAAAHEILVFADVRQSWRARTLRRLLRNFRDPEVGAVSGDLRLARARGSLAGVGLYWRFEKWLRRQESRRYSMVGVTGAVSAVRRSLFRDIPEGTLLDDVYWPLQVNLQDYRVVHEPSAPAYDRLPSGPRAEFTRKVRTLAGNWQLAVRLPAALLPWRNPVWFAFLSHKLMRLAVPWALLGMLVLSLMLPGPLYRVLLAGQLACYLVAVIGLATPIRGAGAATSFLVLNGAAWVAFWVWLTGGTGHSWRKVAYRTARTE